MLAAAYCIESANGSELRGRPQPAEFDLPNPTRREAVATLAALSTLALAGTPLTGRTQTARLQSWPLNTPSRTGIHDVAPAPDGGVWLTAQRSGHLGWFDPKSGRTELVALGRGPYGIRATPAGEVWWCSLAGSFIARIDRKTGDSIVVEPPTKNQGARRVWSDSQGRIWVSEWNSGNLSVHDPAAKTAAQTWRVWKLPGDAPRCYAVYVDDRDMVWTSDFGGNAVFRFDPASEGFERFAFPREATNIRQILGRPGEVWWPESGTEHISVTRTA